MTRPSSTEWRLPPPLMAIHTAWQPPWLLAAVAEHGQNHYEEGAPVQDAHRLALVGRHIVMVVSDGVGSQPHSAEGSRLAVATVERYLAAALSEELPPATVLMAAMAEAHRAIVDLAAARGHKPYEYAATLAVAVLTGDHVAAAGIGDSNILAYTESGATKHRRLTSFLMSPQATGRGIYSIAAADWAEHAAWRAETYAQLKGLLLTSDGANNLFTLDSRGAGYTGFDSDQLDGIDAALEAFGSRRFAFYWAGYLAGTPANDLDDRTILMAYRPADPPTIRDV